MAEVKMEQDQLAKQLREQYPSNSKLHRPPAQNDVQPVVKAPTQVVQETLGAKVKKLFMPANLKDVGKYAFENVIIPNAKIGLLSIVEMVLFNRVSNNYFRPNQNVNNRTNYSYVSTQGLRPQQPIINDRDRAIHNFRNILFASYQDCEDVIGVMLDILERDGRVTVAAFYQLCQQQPDWEDQNWGWTQFQKLEPRAVREGYVIDMTPPVRLK